jgi:hypothetical protein
VKGPLKSHLVSASEFRRIGDRESVKQITRHHECQNRDKGNLNKERKGSTLTCIGFRGFENRTLDLWIREFAKSDLPIVKKGGSHEDCCVCRFPDREIEGPFRILRAEEEGKIL